jgi:hypothetical protein
MLGLGLMPLLVGFPIVVPSVGFSGPASLRHHDMGLQGIEATPDDRHRDRRG